jgi:hypothetical protein
MSVGLSDIKSSEGAVEIVNQIKTKFVKSVESELGKIVPGEVLKVHVRAIRAKALGKTQLSEEEMKSVDKLVTEALISRVSERASVFASNSKSKVILETHLKEAYDEIVKEDAKKEEEKGWFNTTKVFLDDKKKKVTEWVGDDDYHLKKFGIGAAALGAAYVGYKMLKGKSRKSSSSSGSSSSGSGSSSRESSGKNRRRRSRSENGRNRKRGRSTKKRR